MWNVPYISSIYLIKSSAFKYVNYEHSYYDPDMAMCENLRNGVSNLLFYSSISNFISFNNIFIHLIL